ncbi:hypothetical protein LCGC14_1618340 [marine sediment metagenome]|uniref:NTP pyrophosphohydrolase MazG putative catalytic core domain-containing protein n=1 Tax=marine sediment metagenome TaxID=412755 RepID=A0A0F9KLU9_9ZZZZ
MQEDILQAIQDERDRQDAKWGSQRHLSSKMWLTILMEEVGEVANSILEGDSVNYPTELVQVAAVAVAALENYYSQSDAILPTHDSWPEDAGYVRRDSSDDSSYLPIGGGSPEAIKYLQERAED